MIHSLRFRLIMMTVTVAAIAVASVGLLSRYLTLVEFRKYVTRTPTEETAKIEGLRRLFEKQYRDDGNWENAQKLTENVGAATEKQLILVDSNRQILAVYPPELRRADILISPENKITYEFRATDGNAETVQAAVLQNPPRADLHDSGGNNIGTVYSVALKNAGAGEREDVFIGGLNQTLLTASLLSAIIAAGIAVLFSKRILRPIENLTSAVAGLEEGNLQRRVETSSKDEIGSLARAFNSMAERLAQQDDLRRVMINDVAHELRTPLTNIRCHIETIQDGLARPTPEVINSLHEEAMLLNRLIEDLQDLALAESGQLQFEKQRVGVKELVDSAINAVSFPGKNIPAIVQFIEPDCPDLSVDPNRIAQVFRNLLNNAIIHTPADGRITIRARKAHLQIEFCIADTGGGIATEDLPFVFERFYRSDASRSRATGGAGLGLAIVKQIVASHDGRVWIESNSGAGTKVYFTLPVFST